MTPTHQIKLHFRSLTLDPSLFEVCNFKPISKETEMRKLRLRLHKSSQMIYSGNRTRNKGCKHNLLSD